MSGDCSFFCVQEYEAKLRYFLYLSEDFKYMYTINSSSLIFRIIFVAPPHPGGGSRPSAAAPRGLPGCGEAELSQENGPIKSFELIKHASDIQEPSKAFETATVLVAVVEHLSERQRVMRSNR